MWKYPLTSDKNGYVPLEDALQWCNMSFYDGFIAAFCESPEDYEAINKARNAATARLYRGA